MRVIAVYADTFDPSALEALTAYAPNAVKVKAEGLYGYNDVIASRWDGSDSLAVVEHDKEITSEVLPSFEACDQLWCVYSYWNFPEPYSREIVTGLGCTRFSAEIQRAVSVSDFIRPDYGYGPKCKLCDGKGCWVSLDDRITMALMSKGYEPHIHGEVTHHHDYPPADAWLKSLENQFEFVRV